MTETRQLLAELAANLRWAWSREFDLLFSEIDAELWLQSNHNPTAFLADVDPLRIDARARDPHYRVRLERACRSLREYVRSTRHWATRHAPILEASPVAYFCAEFALHESLPLYSGGLGVLAGDHLKSSSDLGVALWGVSLLYRQGYFRQLLDEGGGQSEQYLDTDLARIALEPIVDEDGAQRALDFSVDREDLHARLWKAQVGRTPLLLLEGEYGRPDEADVAARLYAGDQRTRLMQEIILGVGGYKALRMLGVRPGVIHLNEGHSALAVLEATAECMEEDGLDFDAAAQRVRRRTVFTTHTPVEAGHDRFPPDLVEEHLDALRERLRLSPDEFLGLGRVDPADRHEPFCMTVLALKLARRSNAVSSKHGDVSRAMWQCLWPQTPRDNVPIGHVTNGVHVPSWISPRMAQLFDRQLGADWTDRMSRPDVWENIYDADPFELWDVKFHLKQRLLDFVEERVAQRAQRLGQNPPPQLLRPEFLTIGFARRFARYKRADLLFRDSDRLARLVGDAERPVQIIFAGKAHPADDIGKGVLRRVFEHTLDPRFKGRIAFLGDHDMNVSRRLVQGCDLWLNTPLVPLEACGTSGMKAVFSGTLNCSTLDGWWAEGYDSLNGYAYGHGLSHPDQALQDERDATGLLDLLESRVIPDYYERSPEGVPLRWIARMQRALATLGWRYNSDRMVMDYARRCYLPAVGGRAAGFPDEEF
jgi:starch phosphorylase